MDYLTRQLILLLSKIKEAFENHNTATDHIRKTSEQQSKIQKEALEEFLAAHNKSERNRSINEQRNYDVQNSNRYAAWITAIATIAAVFAATWYACITRNTWKEIRKQAETAQKQLEQSQRAWLKVSITADSGFEFTEDGGARITIRTHIQNIGNSAATEIISSVKLILAPMNAPGQGFFHEPIAQQTELCEKITKTPIIPGKTQSDFEQVIFPTDTDDSVGHGLNISKVDIDKTKKTVLGKNGTEELLAPFVVGCVDYQFATAIQHHQTGFVYMLQHHDRTLPPNIYPIRGIRVRHSITASDVEIQKWPFGGFYAY